MYSYQLLSNFFLSDDPKKMEKKSDVRLFSTYTLEPIFCWYLVKLGKVVGIIPNLNIKTNSGGPDGEGGEKASAQLHSQVRSRAVAWQWVERGETRTRGEHGARRSRLQFLPLGSVWRVAVSKAAGLQTTPNRLMLFLLHRCTCFTPSTCIFCYALGYSQTVTSTESSFRTISGGKSHIILI